MGYNKKDPTFFCDCCKRIVVTAQLLAKVSVPCRVYDDKAETYARQLKESALCETCVNKFWEACDENFAVVECSNIRGVEFYPHFDIENPIYKDLHWVGENEEERK